MNGVFCTLILSTLIYCIYLILKKVHFINKKFVKIKNDIVNWHRFSYNRDSDKNEFVCKCCFAKKRLRQGDRI